MGRTLTSAILWRVKKLLLVAPGWRRETAGGHSKRYTIHLVFDVVKMGLDAATSTHQLIAGSVTERPSAPSRPYRRTRRGHPSRSLRHGIAKSDCVFTHAIVPGDDRHQGRRLSQQLRCREMDCVECADRLNRERPADSREDGIRYGDDVTATFKATQCQHRRALLLGRQTSARAGSKNGPSGFCQRQR